MARTAVQRSWQAGSKGTPKVGPILGKNPRAWKLVRKQIGGPPVVTAACSVVGAGIKTIR